MKLTKYEAELYHRLLWLYLADEGCSKEDSRFWIDHKVDVFDVNNTCFACEYCENGQVVGCKKCPINWGHDRYGDPRLCDDWDTPFDRWCHSTTNKQRRVYAKQIAEILFKYE